MATIRTVLKKSKTNAKGEHPIVLRLADSDNKRTHFFTGFYSTEDKFDTSKDGGRFFQGRVENPIESGPLFPHIADPR